MIGEKYIGLDVHQATISVAVMDSKGKVVMESILETQAATILEFFAGLREELQDGFHEDRKSTRLNSSHSQISYAVFCLKKKSRHRLSPAPAPSALRGDRPTCCPSPPGAPPRSTRAHRPPRRSPRRYPLPLTCVHLICRS